MNVELHKLTERDVAEIRLLLQRGMKTIEIAERFGVSRKTVNNVRRNVHKAYDGIKPAKRLRPQRKAK